MSSAIYLWNPAVALELQVEDFAQAERAAYKLYDDHQDSCSSDNPINPLQQWINEVDSVVSNPQYADHFGEDLITEAKRLQVQLQQQPQAVLELDILLQLGGGDSLDRVMYEAVKQYNVGIYDPRYPLWSNMANQLPAHGIDRVLASLPVLSVGVQHIRLDALEVPRNNRAAVELMQNWFKNHPIGKLFTPKTEKPEGTNGYFLTFTKTDIEGIQIIRFYFQGNRIEPTLNFILDLNDRFLTQEQQQNKVLASKFIFKFRWQGFFHNFGRPNQDIVFKQLGNWWDSVSEMTAYFNQLNDWLNYVLDHVSTPEKINTYYNHRQDQTITFSTAAFYVNLNIAAIVQDPDLAQIYQQTYDAIDLDNSAARNHLEQYYKHDIVEIGQIVAAKND